MRSLLTPCPRRHGVTMANDDARRWVLRGGMLFLVGALAGGATVGALSVRASRLFMVMTRFAFEVEQGDRLREALASRNLDMALVHAGCALQTDGTPFDPNQSMWYPTFPLTGLVVTSHPRFGGDNENYYRGLLHARMGVVFEQRGDAESARREFADAARVGGGPDVSKWRRLALVSLGLGAEGTSK